MCSGPGAFRDFYWLVKGGGVLRHPTEGLENSAQVLVMNRLPEALVYRCAIDTQSPAKHCDLAEASDDALAFTGPQPPRQFHYDTSTYPLQAGARRPIPNLVC